MATPITKRIHQTAYKKPSLAKQSKPVTESGYYVKDGKKYKYDATGTPGTSISAGGVLVPDAISGGKAGTPWENKMKQLFRDGASIDDLVKKKHGTKEGLTQLFKGIEQKPKQTSTPGSYNINETLVTDPGKPGTQVDTFSSYDGRQSRRFSKHSGRGQRRAGIKLSKLANISYNPDGSIDLESITPKEGLNHRKMMKFQERLKEYKDALELSKTSSDQVSSQVNPELTARYEFGRGRNTATEGGPSTDVEGLPTAEEIKKKYENIAGGTVNLGTVDSDAGTTTQVESVQENITEDREGNDAKPKPLTTQASSSSGSAAIGYTSKGLLTKLKKPGHKMGGYGSKTYK